MKNRKLTVIFKNYITSVVIVVLLSGCTAIQPLPIAARAGDTVTMAIGSQDGMDKTNTSIVLTDQALTSFTITPKSIFNLYPDKRSSIYDSAASKNLVAITGHEQWLTIMVFDVPSSGVNPGEATLNISTTAVLTGPNARVENLDFPLEILPGVGSAHKLEYPTNDFLGNTIINTGSLNDLEPIPNQVYVLPPNFFSCTLPFGAIDFRFQLQFSIEPYKDYQRFRVVADDLSTLSAGGKMPELSWSAVGSELRVIFTSSDEEVSCHEPRFSIIPKLGNGGASFSIEPVLTSVTYYDTSGNIVVGPDETQYQIYIK